MILQLVVVILLIGTAPLSLAGQAGEAARRIDAARERVAEAGIPASLLDSKVAEGRAKGVPMDRIAAAVEGRADALVRAQVVMGREMSGADLSVGADALQAGASEAALRTLSEAAPPEQRAVAIAALAHLVRSGEASERALARVRAALAEGPEALRRLPAEAAAARGRRGPPPGVGPPGDRPGGAAGRPGAGGGGPPPGVPGPGKKPGSGKPDGAGNPPGTPGGKPPGTPGGGKPPGTPGGPP